MKKSFLTVILSDDDGFSATETFSYFSYVFLEYLYLFAEQYHCLMVVRFSKDDHFIEFTHDFRK